MKLDARNAARIALIVCTLLALLVPVEPAGADDPAGPFAPAVAAAPERYVPTVRGPRASYDTEAVQQWREAVDVYAWDTETALLVMACESMGRADAVNPSSGATGLFQVMEQWQRLARFLTGSRDLTDPAVNIAVAFYLWADSGQTFRWHWAASHSCWGWR